jgi:sulfatase modifying factor 1
VIARSSRRLATLGLGAVLLAPACAVSFDGYSLERGTAGAQAPGGAAGSGIGGVPSAGGGADASGSPGTGGVAGATTGGGNGVNGGTRPSGGSGAVGGSTAGTSSGGSGAVGGSTAGRSSGGIGGASPTGGTITTGGNGLNGGTAPSGGKGAVGGSSAGSSSGGSGIGGASPTGGTTTGGNGPTGGAGPAGGSATGGRATGGSATGGSTGGSATGGSATGGRGTGGSGGSGTCPVGLPGPALVQVPKTAGGYFCMDRTEVTNEQYAAFVNAGAAAQQPPACSFNTSFLPTTSGTDCPTLRYDPVGQPRYPVTCIDWCDAYAFCAWAQKRLCGDLAGGAVATANLADAAHDQWYVACSRGGTRAFPYGTSYQSGVCVDVSNPTLAPLETASATGCEGGYPGIFDLSGNVAEWEDSCSANSGAADSCADRGGSLFDGQYSTPSVRCDSSDQHQRQTRHQAVGFRCCWDSG